MEIVIENPVESSPPPPPPPPPPLPPPPLPSTYPLTPSTKPPCGQQASNGVQMPAATTVMTITIAENPAALSHPPVRFSYRENSYASNTLSCASTLLGDAYGRRSIQRRAYDDPEDAPSVRRIDKSGLLGITEPEPSSGFRTGLRSPRFLSGVGSSGLVSPRRLECVGQLDPVPEVPGQTSRANVAVPGPAYHPCVMPVLDRREPCEALTVATLGRPSKSSSFDSLEPKRNDRLDMENLHHRRAFEGVESSSAGYGSLFRFQEGYEARARTLGRLSRLSMKRTDRENKIEGLAKYSETCCSSFPFKARPATVAIPSSIEAASSGLPTSRAITATTASSSTTTVSTTKEEGELKVVQGRTGGKNDEGSSPVPGEERAEAEGCEHGPTRNPMKDESSSKRADELLDNDGIQTLRVIILSEQL